MPRYCCRSSCNGASCGFSNWPGLPCMTFSYGSPVRRQERTIMRKTLVIVIREYQASVRSKAFIISMVIMPVFMGASVVMQTLFKDNGEKKQRTFALIDRTPGQTLQKQIQEQARKKPE